MGEGARHHEDDGVVPHLRAGTARLIDIKRVIVATVAAGLMLALVGALGAGTLAASASAKLKPKKPTADVILSQSVHVLGAHFKPSERLTVTLAARGQKWTRKVRAKKTGSFDLDLGTLGLNACNAYTLKVVGALGSRVSFSHYEPC